MVKSRNYRVISNRTGGVIRNIKVPEGIKVVPTYSTVRIQE